MLVILFFLVGRAAPTGLRLLDKSSEGETEIVTWNRRRLKLRLSEFDFIDEDDVGLDNAHWEDLDRRPRVRWAGKRHSKNRKGGEYSVASGSSKHSKKHHHHHEHKKHRHRSHKIRRSRRGHHQRHHKHRNDGDSDDDESEDNKSNAVLKSVNESEGQSNEKKNTDGSKSKPSQEDLKSKLEKKLQDLSEELKRKTKKSQDKCDKNEKTVECIQSKLSKSLVSLNRHQMECELKCLAGDGIEKCRKGCAAAKGEALYKTMESYLEKKKTILSDKCSGLCKKTGKAGDIYNCWKCRMSENLARVARCRHRCQHEVKKSQKKQCFPACLTAVTKNMKVLMNKDKELQGAVT